MVLRRDDEDCNPMGAEGKMSDLATKAQWAPILVPPDPIWPRECVTVIELWRKVNNGMILVDRWVEAADGTRIKLPCY